MEFPSYTPLMETLRLIHDYWSALAGSFVSFLVAMDYSLGRFCAGTASGLFMAYYFTDVLLYYVPMPSTLTIDQQCTLGGALWGLTGYIVVSTLLIFAQTKTTQILGKMGDSDAPDKGGKTP